jgi:hypothetical protein
LFIRAKISDLIGDGCQPEAVSNFSNMIYLLHGYHEDKKAPEKQPVACCFEDPMANFRSRRISRDGNAALTPRSPVDGSKSQESPWLSFLQ